MSEQEVVFVGIAIAVALIVLVAVVASKASNPIRDMLHDLAVAAGWSGVTRARLQSGVKGTWRSFAVSLVYMARQKSVPRRLQVKIAARSDVRLFVRRRFPGMLSNKPLTWFGPPLVEVHAPAAAPFWVRADEVNLAERLFADAAVTAAIDATLVARFDELKVNKNGLQIIRAIDEKPVQNKYGIAFSFRVDPAQVQPLAKEEWNAAEAVVNKLSLM